MNTKFLITVILTILFLLGQAQVASAQASNQVDFEMLSEDYLQKAVIQDGRLHLADQSFATLMIPETRMLSMASMAKLETFAANGGHVVFKRGMYTHRRSPAWVMKLTMTNWREYRSV